MHWIWPALVKRKPKVERLSQGSANASTVTDPVTRDGSDRGVPQTKTGTRSVSDLSLEILGL